MNLENAALRKVMQRMLRGQGVTRLLWRRAKFRVVLACFCFVDDQHEGV